MPQQHFTSGEYKSYLSNTNAQYKAFVPSPVNKPYQPHNRDIFVYLEKATHSLSTLNAYSRLIPDVDLFIRMHINNEAVKSSKIEGTKIDTGEAVLPDKKEIELEKQDDWEEVQNYIKAMDYGIDRLRELPLSMRFVCEVHNLLMQGVRGQKKNPGKIRTAQNWIGGKDINTAVFVPPHPNDLSNTLTDLEKFWHNDEILMPNLIKVAISHYQFETIHPFSDGNGRTGRILIILQLMEMGMMDKPTLYLSDFFENNRQAYYEGLSGVRKDSDIDQWILFFLQGIVETAQKGSITFQKIIDLEQEYNKKILTFGGRKAEQVNELLKYAFSYPAFNSAMIQKQLSVSATTANSLIQDLTKLNILKEITGYSRNRIFVLHEYVDLFK